MFFGPAETYLGQFERGKTPFAPSVSALAGYPPVNINTPPAARSLATPSTPRDTSVSKNVPAPSGGFTVA